MSNWYKKVEYTCQCGQDYGSCGKIGKFFLKYIGVSDVYVLLSQSHPDSKVQELGYFDDNSLNALAKLLNTDSDNLDGCSSEEVEEINKTIK